MQAVPYWIDDVSLRQAIIDSGGQRILALEEQGTGPGANQVYDHLLPFGTTVNNRMATAVGRTAADKAASKGLVGEKAPLLGQPAPASQNKSGLNFGNSDEFGEYYDEEEDDGEDVGCSWPFAFCSRYNVEFLAPTSIQKIEPKLFFANERTYLHWLHHGVILSSIASGILAFSDESGATWGQWYALALLPISLGFCIYALNIFLWRADRIKTRIPGRWDDPVGPMILGGSVVAVLALNFMVKLYTIAQADHLEL